MGFDKLINSWAAIFPLAVLLYYFFRKRYETKTISSTLFWEESMREMKVSPYLKNLQRNALFYLQMAALVLLVVVLLDPFVKKEGSLDGHTVFVVDTSATMLAEPDGQSLWNRHKTLMEELAVERTGQPISIITTGKEPSLLLREETDGELVRSAIDKLEVAYEHEHMDHAIEFVKSFLLSEPADVHIFTDALDRNQFTEADEAISWNIHSSNEPIKNLSILNFGAVRTSDGNEAIVKIGNQSGVIVEGMVKIKDPLTDDVLAEQKISIEGNKEQLVSFKELPPRQALLAELDMDDEYAADNAATILLGNELSEAVVDVQLHELVKKAFEAVNLAVTSGGAQEMAAAQDSAIVVTNDASFLKKGSKPFLLIGRNDASPVPASGTIKTEDHPLFALSELSEVYVAELYPPFRNFTTLATVGDKPFIQQSKRGDIVILSDIEMTDWPLHPSFPLFIWSTTEMLGADVDSLGVFTPKERKAVLSGGDEMELFTLQDEYITSVAEGAQFVAPSVPDLYKAIDGRSERLFSVQLEQSEKEVRSGSSFRVGRKAENETEEEGHSGIGWFLILPILVLLLAEWEVQRRRGYPN
ncbi:BatA and WFA domain-containing protein [Sporosarcina sp. 179-K 3D1 HS]|uniref:vWA domain-containing protein n=1 Tax=Sporosarcina sp. 179-K 3D1 HS TaxID=3232169 RepID=UPI0039A0E6CC